MRSTLRLALVLIAAMCIGTSTALAYWTIHVRFTNNTHHTVYFYLNGGGGLRTSLEPGATQDYNMTVNRGVPPSVRIHQPNGGSNSFSVQNGGNYQFIWQNGQIVNAYQN